MKVRRVLLTRDKMQLHAFDDNGNVKYKSRIIDISNDNSRPCHYTNGVVHYMDEEDIEYEMTASLWGQVLIVV